MRIPEERGYRSMKNLRRSCPTQKHPRKGLAVHWPMKQEDQPVLQTILFSAALLSQTIGGL